MTKTLKQMTKARLLRLISRDSFLRPYFETALWSSSDDSDDSGGEPLDRNYQNSDFTKEGLITLIEIAQKFENDSQVIRAVSYGEDVFDMGWDQAAHDLWLTQNGHGAGFWDGDWPEPSAATLTRKAHDLGEVNIYVGDNGRLYVFYEG